MIELLILGGIAYTLLKGETNITFTNKDKNKRYKFHSKDFKCSYGSEDIKKSKKN